MTMSFPRTGWVKMEKFVSLRVRRGKAIPLKRLLSLSFHFIQSQGRNDGNLDSNDMCELSAGTLKRNETPLACAKREIIEETGYSAIKFKKLGHIYPVPGYSTERIIIFKAEGLEKQYMY